MTLPDYLKQVRERMERLAVRPMPTDAPVLFYAHAPTDIYRLLQIVEIYREALDEISQLASLDACMNAIGIAKPALRRAEEIVK